MSNASAEDLIENSKTINGNERVKNKKFLEPIIQKWMKARTKDEVVETLFKHGVPAGPAQNVKDVAN
ncbi:MAG: CoA transferase [Deltaproteobacteria bacterium]|nr:CoA transferase [Deltaproteobacteria bacterium]MBW2305602.1 CoA transferase [Deltaproteobacteria bacterium]